MNQYRKSQPSNLRPRISLRRLLVTIIFHVGLLWAALALGYNSYKEIMREIDPLTRAVRDSIKATFPWAIMIFLISYFFISIKKAEKIPLEIRQYGYIIAIYGILLNFLFFAKGKDILIPINLSILYIIILLVIFWNLRKLLYVKELNFLYFSNLQEWIPPIIYRFLIKYWPKAKAYIREKPSAPFITGFMALLMICALFLIFKSEKAAEELANIAYFSMVIGVGIELYQMIRHKNKNEEKED